MVNEDIREKIQFVADNCIRCRLCMKECIMLNRFTQNPKMLFKQYLDTGTIDPMIAYSCNECSQCTLKCPRHLDLRSIFRSLKADYARENGGTVPLAALQPSEAGQVRECDPAYCTRVSGKNNPKKTKYVFVPGCTVPAYSPKLVDNVLRHLKQTLGDENVGALLQCCGKVSLFMGETEKFHARNQLALDQLDAMGAEVVVTVCPSCFKVFKATCKNQTVISYWDLMHDVIGIPESARGIGAGSDVVFNIHDSCVTRDEPTHHESVRWALDQMGYRWEEIPRNRENTRCCGVGGMVCSSDPEIYAQVYSRRREEFTREHVISYCGSCRGTFETADMDSLHILDLLFGEGPYMQAQAGKRGYRNAEEMWGNRLETRRLLNTYQK